MKNAWKKLFKSNRKTATSTSLTLVAPFNTGSRNIYAQVINIEADISIPAIQETHSPFDVGQTSGPEELSGNSTVTPITSTQSDFKSIVMSTDMQDSIHSSEPISQNPGPTPTSHEPDTTRALE